MIHLIECNETYKKLLDYNDHPKKHVKNRDKHESVIYAKHTLEMTVWIIINTFFCNILLDLGTL